MVNLTERLLQAILTIPLFLLAYQSVQRTTKRRRDSISLETSMSMLTILVSVQGTSESSFMDALLGPTYTSRIATVSSTWEKMALAKKDVRGTLVYEDTTDLDLRCCRRFLLPASRWYNHLERLSRCPIRLLRPSNPNNHTLVQWPRVSVSHFVLFYFEKFHVRLLYILIANFGARFTCRTDPRAGRCTGVTKDVGVCVSPFLPCIWLLRSYPRSNSVAMMGGRIVIGLPLDLFAPFYTYVSAMCNPPYRKVPVLHMFVSVLTSFT